MRAHRCLPGAVEVCRRGHDPSHRKAGAHNGRDPEGGHHRKDQARLPSTESSTIPSAMVKVRRRDRCVLPPSMLITNPEHMHDALNGSNGGLSG